MSVVYTVKQISAYIKNMFTSDFLLSSVTVRGEVSNFKDHPSGHIYFTLKDGDAAISAVMFAGKRRGLKCRLREGLQVSVTGSVSVYEAAGRYQLYAEQIEEEGEGELYRRYLRLKAELADMGMFDDSFKKPIPKYPMTIGIVTSSSGAALQDIIKVTRRRNPYARLILSPAQVQGEGAASSIIAAIERLDRIRPDVMIVGRGGGSMEDLWCFNDEGVARAVFDADTPVISAVGHEVDFTIIDFVADRRAATPSAAAEIAAFDASQLEKDMTGLLNEGRSTLMMRISRKKAETERLNLMMASRHPANRLNEKQMTLADLSERMYRLTDRRFQEGRNEQRALEEKLRSLMEMRMNARRTKYTLLAQALDLSSPLKKLQGGYGYISKNGQALKSVSEAAYGDRIMITLHDGTIGAEVVQEEDNG